MRHCIDEGKLQAWFDEELSAEEMSVVRTHLSACAQCAEAERMMAAENSILAGALAAEFDGAVPSERLRHRIDAAVAGSALVRPQADIDSRWNQNLRSIFTFVRPRMFAYASTLAAIVLTIVFGLIYLKRERATSVTVKEAPRELTSATPQPTPERIPTLPESARAPNIPTQEPRRPADRKAAGTEPKLTKRERKYEKTIANLSAAIQSQPPLRPALRVEYEYNLALIDHAIATTRDAARKNPKDEQAAQFMFAAYQSKVDLMNQITSARTIDR